MERGVFRSSPGFDANAMVHTDDGRQRAFDGTRLPFFFTAILFLTTVLLGDWLMLVYRD
jgi:hypothetical protein